MREVNFETIFFIKHLDELARKAKNGVKHISELTEENKDDFVFYGNMDENGEYPVILQRKPSLTHPCYEVILDKGDNYWVVVDREGNLFVYCYVKVRKCFVEYRIGFKDGDWFICS